MLFNPSLRKYMNLGKTEYRTATADSGKHYLPFFVAQI